MICPLDGQACSICDDRCIVKPRNRTLDVEYEVVQTTIFFVTPSRLKWDLKSDWL